MFWTSLRCFLGTWDISVCPQKSRSPWQHKLKSVVPEIFVYMALIKAMVLVPKCPIIDIVAIGGSSALMVSMSTHKGTWRRCFLHGWAAVQVPFMVWVLEQRLACSMYSQLPELGGFSEGLGNLLLVHPQFPDQLWWSRRNRIRKSTNKKYKRCVGQVPSAGLL